MGKAARWIRGLFGIKKDQSPSPATTTAGPKQAKRRWSFGKSYREKDRAGDRRCAQEIAVPPVYGDVDPSKHAIAVAAATAAVAEAAVVAAQAAAEVVRMTSGAAERCSGPLNSAGAHDSVVRCGIREEEMAAVKIQAHFRAYLSRRALRALKALVKLQALVRGHIVRKQSAEMLRRMQALLRAQARACAGRALATDSPNSSSKSSLSLYHGPETPEKCEHIRAKNMKYDQSMLKRNGSKSTDQDTAHSGSKKTGPTTDDEKSYKILEMDTTERRFNPKGRTSHYAAATDINSRSCATSRDSTTHQTAPSLSSCEMQSLSPLIISQEAEEESFCTADSSPHFYSASARRNAFTPTNSEGGSRSYISGYSEYYPPSYMACTESSRAKARSLSAPKQRPQFERSDSSRRSLFHGESTRSRTLSISTLHASFTGKAYPGSGRLDRLGMPIGDYPGVGYNNGDH